jgi:hypothetical protein
MTSATVAAGARPSRISPIGPAVADALAAATGRRPRILHCIATPELASVEAIFQDDLRSLEFGEYRTRIFPAFSN